jgi:fatty-acyl-CoA synthase
MLYTGGTTGNPKGVVWRHVDLFGALAFTAYASAGIEVPTTPADVGRIAAELQAEGRSPVMLCAPPLMHGTALFLAIGAFVMGGSVVLLGGRSFDAAELWQLVERHRVTQISLVGDAFARPMNDALDAAERDGALPDLTSVTRIVSTGATLSAEQKRAFQRRLPNAVILDMIGASEGGPYAMSMTMPGQDPPETAIFTAPPNVVTIDAVTGTVLPRGSSEPGMLAAAGPMPVGYWNDEAKTATTFRVVDGVRYTVPGDFATIAEDGTVTLLGRGSVCINSGGEKIYPEEVEVAARRHPTVIDANVVGVPHERFGETVDITGEVSRVCQRCHFEKYTDWQLGIHGRGQPKCSAAGCHDPHTPGWIYVAALPPFQGTGIEVRAVAPREPFTAMAPPPVEPPVTTPTWLVVIAVAGSLYAFAVIGFLTLGRRKA